MSADHTAFADLLEARTPHPDRVAFPIPADWLQGRTAFGGLIAAVAVQAMRDVAGVDWPAHLRLRSLQTHFIAPVVEGSAIVVVEVLRLGRSVQQLQARVESAGQLAALVVAVYASPRPTDVATLAPAQPPVQATPATAPSRRFVPGQGPRFLQHFHFGWAAGDPPMSGGTGWETRIFLRLLDDRPHCVDPDVLVVLLADAPPTPAMSQFKRPAPASSVTWTLELLPSDEPVAVDDWWRIDTLARSASQGYVNHTSTLWSPRATAVAVGHQLVAVYA